MDTRKHTANRLTATAIAVAACIVFFGPSARSNTGQAPIVVHGGETGQEQSVDWALRRYRAAGLPALPPLELYLHGSREGCGGNNGFYRGGRIDLCTRESSRPYARKIALHEMAHAWTDAHVGAGVEARFMRLRGIDAWNDWSLPWRERGFEQAAEIIAWGVGEGAMQGK